MSRTGGIINMPAGALAGQKQTPPKGAPTGPAPKQPSPRLKVVLRRLPPGLTQDEFEKAMGEDWKVGAGKVDWYTFKPGKVSKDLSKPSLPSRAYFKLNDQGTVNDLGTFVRQNQSNFTDAKGTSKDPVLIGPPSLEYAPFPRIAQSRTKTDPRQGLIDQDSEFQQFLQSLTDPITKPEASEEETKKPEKVTTTPLIEAIRQKKAQKEKPQPMKPSTAKHGRSGSREEKDKKTVGDAGKKGAATNEKSKRANSKAERERAAREAVKVLTKEASAAAANAVSSAASSAASNRASSQPPEQKQRERERGTAAAVKSLLQRDLGLAPAGGRRRGARGKENQSTANQTSTPATFAEAQSQAESTATPAAPSKKDSRPSRSERKAANRQKVADTGNEEESPKPVVKIPTGPAAPSPKILKKAPANNQQPPQAPKAPAPAPRPILAKPNAPPTAPKSPAPSNPTSPAAAPATPATASAPSPPARQAFLKHANPSQGITEPLIEAALSIFGAIEKVEIDKRKGFAYVDFVEPEGLRKAMAAKKVNVAEGAVEILERKERAAQRHQPQPRAGRGMPSPIRGGGGGIRRGGGMGRGGANANAGNAGASATATPTPAVAPT